MAQTVLLSVALLSVVLSFHGALGISGCRVTQTGLENYCLSTKDHWAQSLQGPIQQLPGPALPGLAGCRFDVLTCERVSVVFRPPYGLDVVVCLVVQIKCSLLLLPATVRVAFCATIRLAVVPLGLSFGSCSSEYVEVKIDPLINLQLPAVAKILAPVLDPVVGLTEHFISPLLAAPHQQSGSKKQEAKSVDRRPLPLQCSLQGNLVSLLHLCFIVVVV
ncbi:uncharacterized protein LOC128415144 [Podarcis raffonei]|uniref:uncharacterized protein LOC128415144 n=1 Tax=Podarcis raffonei TaxID=65483 RepID=UPI0023296FFD|nr:uncharacterized protein LOC128415144 [Podarcis raffonei]